MQTQCEGLGRGSQGSRASHSWEASRGPTATDTSVSDVCLPNCENTTLLFQATKSVVMCWGSHKKPRRPVMVAESQSTSELGGEGHVDPPRRRCRRPQG